VLGEQQLIKRTVEIEPILHWWHAREDADRPHLGRGRKDQPRTTKRRFSQLSKGHHIQTNALLQAKPGLGMCPLRRSVLGENLDVSAHLMTAPAS
jgi:hypothetical protein